MSMSIKQRAVTHNFSLTQEGSSKRFQNGDFYTGQWRDDKPDGDGKYTWENGSEYDGTWQRGRQHGVGKYVWPSGATYQGEWQAGSMHGVGTLTSPNAGADGSQTYPNLDAARSFSNPSRNLHLAHGTASISRYQGSWVRGKRQGLGKQNYLKGDIYEGLWKEDLQEGPGRYMFTSGDEYDGEWRDGLMHGQGTFVWNGGERYDGAWKNGKPDGLGLLTLFDGTTYDSQWKAGKRHGVCVYTTPELGKSKTMRRGSMKNFQLSSLAIPTGKTIEENTSPSGPPPMLWQMKGGSPAGGNDKEPAPVGGLQGLLGPKEPQQTKAGSTYIRIYHFGSITKEWPMSKEEAGGVLTHLAASRPGSGISRLLRSKTGGSSSGGAPGDLGAPTMGEAISKTHTAYHVMLALQLGMRYSITRVTPEPGFRQLDEYDFNQKVEQFFPRGGSEMTAVHSGEEFTWKDYAPMAFRKLREFFEIDAGSYMRSLCGDTALRLLNSPGKSGAVFLLTSDDQYFVKTVAKHEVNLLCSMLPLYYHHVSNHPHTLLTRFYGLHQVALKSGRKVHLVVMANLFNQTQLHRKFDIKGSTLGRTAGPGAKEKANAILKDLDLDESFKLEDGWAARLANQLKADCTLLEQCKIMDYSLLMGVYYVNRQDKETAQHNFAEVCPDEEYNQGFPKLCEKVAKSKLPEDARSALLSLLRARLERNQQRAAMQKGLSTTDALALAQGNSRVQLGVNMPAKATLKNGEGGNPEEVVLYFGIIDILQDYDTRKKIEHKLKSIIHDSYAVSVCNPNVYSHRFQEFLMSTFS